MDREISYAASSKGSKASSFQAKKPFGMQSRTADDENEVKKSLDLNEYLIGNKATTFFMRVSGEAMIGAGIFDGDMIVVDRSLKVSNGKVVIAMLNGEMLIRRFEKNYNKIRLLPDTNRLSPIDIDPSGADFSIWGVVTYVIHVP
jgi:DNA polymerase V